MKILYVLPSLGYGGVEKIVTTLAENLCESNQIFILYFKGENVYLKNSAIKIYKIDINKTGDLFLKFNEILKLINIISPDIIHTHTIFPNLIFRILKFFNVKIKLINSEHGSLDCNGFGKYLNIVNKITLHKANLLSFVSCNSMADYILHFPFNKCSVVYNGVNTNIFKNNNISNSLKKEFNLSLNSKIIMYVGRLSSEKNVKGIIDVFSQISGDNLLVIVGSGPEYDFLLNYSKKINRDNSIIFLGSRSDIHDLLNMANIVVLNSLTEGLPTILLEAMATEKIVISSDCGGVSEILSKDFIFPVNDSLEFKNKISYYLNLNLIESSEIGYNNRKIVLDRFSSDTMSIKWLNIYSEICK